MKPKMDRVRVAPARCWRRPSLWAGRILNDAVVFAQRYLSTMYIYTDDWKSPASRCCSSCCWKMSWKCRKERQVRTSTYRLVPRCSAGRRGRVHEPPQAAMAERVALGAALSSPDQGQGQPADCSPTRRQSLSLPSLNSPRCPSNVDARKRIAQNNSPPSGNTCPTE